MKEWLTRVKQIAAHPLGRLAVQRLLLVVLGALLAGLAAAGLVPPEVLACVNSASGWKW